MIIVGPLPKPLGGISTYVYRFALQNRGKIKAILDLYPDSPKESVPFIPHLISPTNPILKFLWLTVQLIRAGSSDVFFNFSSTSKLPFLLLIPKLGKWILILHHGDLDSHFQRKSWVFRSLTIAQLNRFNEIQVISKEQDKFFTELPHFKGKLVRTSSYLPITPTQRASGSSLVPTDIDLFLKQHRVIILTSGYLIPIYRFELVIDLIQKISGISIGLLICTYGKAEKKYKELIYSKVSSNSSIKLVSNLEMHQFIDVMKRCHIYVRANCVDSFGLAAADALSLGLEVVASDACERLEGMRLFPVDNTEMLESLVLSAILKINERSTC